MKQVLALSLLAAAASALPHSKRAVASVTTHTHSTREVPQEHSHEQILRTVKTLLDLNNPDEIQDTVFGLLGNAAGSKGQGKITDTDCLQQATADQAFTNAKAAGDVAGQTAALIYRALERNTGKVGLASVACTAIKAVNPEIAAIQQHQDAASDNAAEVNKAITLELAKQIAAIGGNAQDALLAGTFAPGDLNDATAAGFTCDVADDAVGCIFTQNLIQVDASAAEIAAAVGAAGVNANVASIAQGAAADVVGGNANAAAGAKAAGDAKAGAEANKAGAEANKAGAEANKAGAEANAASAASAVGASAAASAAGASNAAAGALDFGQCADPAIQFAAGLDGRKEESFQAVDQTDFNHGSALNIKVITGFIQNRLADQCKASQATLDAAKAAETAALAASGQGAADAWNQALGVSA